MGEIQGFECGTKTQTVSSYQLMSQRCSVSNVSELSYHWDREFPDQYPSTEQATEAQPSVSPIGI